MLTKAVTVSCVIALVACLIGPRVSWADQDLVTFAENAYVDAQHPVQHGRCSVCQSRLFQSKQLLEILDGRYQFEDVEQAYCPVCQVTTLSMESTPRASRFFRLLSWRIPVTREKVVYQDNRYSLAFKSSATLPFISNIFGLETRNGQVYFEVE